MGPLGPCGDLPGTCQGPASDRPGTCQRPTRASPRRRAKRGPVFRHAACPAAPAHALRWADRDQQMSARGDSPAFGGHSRAPAMVPGAWRLGAWRLEVGPMQAFPYPRGLAGAGRGGRKHAIVYPIGYKSRRCQRRSAAAARGWRDALAGRVHAPTNPCLCCAMVHRGRVAPPQRSSALPTRHSIQPSDCPPSTANVCPVTQLARSEQRNTATVAISSG